VSSVEVHPFDVMQLAKGDWISPDRCEEIVGVSRTHREYSRKLVSICEHTEKQWARLRDEVAVVVQEKDGIRICTDDEAVPYLRRRREGHVRGLKRTQLRQMGVDTSKLSTPELRSLHERECIVGAAFLLGGKKEQRAMLRAHQRSTPALTAKK
jgi:hypothetical protein